MKTNLKDIREDQLKELRKIEIMKELYSFLTESMKLTDKSRGKPPTFEETSTLIEGSVEAIEEIFSGVKTTGVMAKGDLGSLSLLLKKGEIMDLVVRLVRVGTTEEPGDKTAESLDKLIEEIIEVARR